jgi:CubicO group peptidase (beta-lactamase class C family)
VRGRSTARDLAQWLRLQLGEGTGDGRQLVKPEVLAQTHLPHIVNAINPETGDPQFYGLGWIVTPTTRGARS